MTNAKTRDDLSSLAARVASAKRYQQAKNESLKRPRHPILAWWLLVVLLAASVAFFIRGVIDFHNDKVLNSAVKSALNLGGLAPPPFLRIYVSRGATSLPLNVTSELGRKVSGDGQAFTWIHVSLDVARSEGVEPSGTFGWKIALLCVPQDTVVLSDAGLMETSPPAFLANGTPPRNGCPSTADYEIIVTGKYGPRFAQEAPSSNIADDASGLVSFGIPQTGKPMISNTGSDYQASFPHVASLVSLCPEKQFQPPGAFYGDGGPLPSKKESALPDCNEIKTLGITKVLDLPAKAKLEDTVQTPTATFPVDPDSGTPRAGLAWQDTQDNSVRSVEVNSPIQDARAHVDEIYGAVYWGLAGAAAVALLVEVRERSADFSRLWYKIRGRPSI